MSAAGRSNRRPQPSANSVSAANSSLSSGEVVADVAGGVAGRLDDVDRVAAKLEAVAIAIGVVEAGNGDRLVERADDLAAELLLQRQIAFDMVGVMMGGEDVGDRPAAARRSGGRSAAASGASIEAVRPVSGSCTRTPKLSVRQGKTSSSKGFMAQMS